MPKKRIPWVKDPAAIQTLAALGEIKPGDEIKCGPCRKNPEHSKQDQREKHWFHKTVLVVSYLDAHESYPIDVHQKRNRVYTWSACYCQIRAWRRPHEVPPVVVPTHGWREVEAPRTEVARFPSVCRAIAKSDGSTWVYVQRNIMAWRRPRG